MYDTVQSFQSRYMVKHFPVHLAQYLEETFAVVLVVLVKPIKKSIKRKKYTNSNIVLHSHIDFKSQLKSNL